jgi:hypothetical protein
MEVDFCRITSFNLSEIHALRKLHSKSILGTVQCQTKQLLCHALWGGLSIDKLGCPQIPIEKTRYHPVVVDVTELNLNEVRREADKMPDLV